MAKRAVPNGFYAELNIDLLQEGDFRKQFDEALQRAYREYLQWEEASDKRNGSFTVTAKITGARANGTSDHFALKTLINVTPQNISKVSMVRAGGDRLLCQPEGSNTGDPDQMRLFDGQGNPKGAVDLETGEVVDEDELDTVGKVGHG